MASEENNTSKLSELRKDIGTLREKINESDNKKETLFEQRSSTSRKIIESINKIKELKKERDQLTSDVKDLKEVRNTTNNLLKEKVGQFKQLKDEQSSLTKTLNLKEDPMKLKDKIEFLEMKIQTEALPFNKEKNMMKTINDLKKQYKEMESVTGVMDRIRTLSKDIRQIKTEADKAHRQIQEKAKLSQQLHEQMIALSKEVDELKKVEKDQQSAFNEAKEAFKQVNEELKGRLDVLNNISKEINQDKQEKKKEKKKLEEKTLKEKTKEVEEKIKNKKKLTTEDLLVFQGIGNRRHDRSEPEAEAQDEQPTSEAPSSESPAQDDENKQTE